MPLAFRRGTNMPSIGVGNSPVFLSGRKPPGPSGPVYEDEYQAVLDYATANAIALPDEATQLLQNQLVADLKTANAWVQLDLLYIFAGPNSDFARLNWVSPGDYTATIVNTLPFTASQGFKNTDVTTGILRTGFNPFNNASVATTDNTSKFFYSYGSYSKDSIFTGVHEPVGDEYWESSSSTILVRINGTNALAPSSVNTAVAGFQMASRTNSTEMELYIGGVNYSRFSTSQGFLVNRELAILGTAGVAANDDWGMSAFGYGASLHGSNSAVKTAFDDYIGAL